MNNENIRPVPLYKGVTRVPTYFGVPTYPLLTAVGGVAIIAMWTSLWCWLLAIPIVTIMRLITKHDDRAFSIWWLWFETKARNKNKAFWAASSYTPAKHRKNWDSRE